MPIQLPLFWTRVGFQGVKTRNETELFTTADFYSGIDGAWFDWVSLDVGTYRMVWGACDYAAQR
jgi:hypothetical protein